MKKIENQVIEFNGGGIIKLEVLENGISLVFQSPHLGEQFRIVSMNVVLNQEEAEKITNWFNNALGENDV
ncbi:MAG: hypothetical protein WC516_07110 [Patescibacteria group bacterium]